jgi:anti-anti-sigma factor
MVEGQPRFRLLPQETETRSGATYLLTVEGELDLSNVNEFEAALRLEAWDGKSAVLIDLCHVGFMDSSGLRALLFAGQELDEAGIPWAVVLQPGSPINQVFELAQVVDRIPAYETLEAATGAIEDRNQTSDG